MQLSAAKDDLERPATNEPLDNPCEGRGAIYGRACPSRKMVKRKERKMAEQYVLAADRVTIIAATGGLRSVQAAKKATSTIPTRPAK